MVVAPGFIDIHSHGRRGIAQVPTAENYLREGVTTIVEGPDGSSPLPIKDFLDGIARTPISINFATMVGQGSIRQQVIGSVNRKATSDEIAKMKDITALVRQWALEGGQKSTNERLAGPEQRARIKATIVENLKYDRGAGDPKNVAIVNCAFDRTLAGKNLAQIATDRGMQPTMENAA